MQRMRMNHERPASIRALGSGLVVESCSKLILMFPGTSKLVKLLGRKALPVDKDSVEEDDQPSLIRICEKQRIAGINSGLPIGRRLSKRQTGTGNERSVLHSEERHEVYALVRRLAPGTNECPRFQLTKHQIIIANVLLLFRQLGQPAASRQQNQGHPPEEADGQDSRQGSSDNRTVSGHVTRLGLSNHSSLRLFGSLGLTGWQISHRQSRRRRL